MMMILETSFNGWEDGPCYPTAPLPYFNVGYEHSSAAVTCDSQIFENLLGIFSLLGSFLVFLKVGGYHLTTAYASYGNHVVLFFTIE
jgi:hypothetical protein